MDFDGVDEDESSIGITMRDKEREILERGNVVWRERERERERESKKERKRGGCMYCRVFLWRESCAGARRA